MKVTGEAVGAITPASLSAAAPVSGVIKVFRGSKQYSDLLVLANSTDFYEGAYEALGREGAYKIDRHILANISSSMTLKLAQGTQSAGWTKANTSAVLRGKEIARLVPLLQTYCVPAFDDDCYVGVAHPLASYDLFSDISATGWVSTAQYGDPNRIYRGEIGQMYGIRFLLTPLITRAVGAAGTSSTVGLSGTVSGANLWVFGAHAFFDLEFEEGGMKVIHQDLGSAGAADSTADYGTVGIKHYFGVAPTPYADKR